MRYHARTLRCILEDLTMISRFSLVALLALTLTACATGPSADEIAAQQAATAAAAEAEQAAQRAAAEAQLEAQRVEQERLLAEDRARAAAAAEAERREADARAAAERQTQIEAERRRAEAAPNVEERAQAVARQQERIAELRAQIAATRAETTNIEQANATLLQAITAAEDLVTTLTDEQDKYGARDPATGQTTEPLSKERIAELNAELERLQAQAAALSQQQP